MVLGKGLWVPGKRDLPSYVWIPSEKDGNKSEGLFVHLTRYKELYLLKGAGFQAAQTLEIFCSC